jgi:C-terminal processing protease CtpA/Prc
VLLSTSTKQAIGIRFEATDEGIRVTEVLADSPASRLGLESGDVILSVYEHPVSNAETWYWLTSYKNSYVPLRIRDSRTGAVVTLYADLS